MGPQLQEIANCFEDVGSDTAALFGEDKCSDCRIEICLEANADSSDGPPAKRARLNSLGHGASLTTNADTVLPAHLVVLQPVSGYFTVKGHTEVGCSASGDKAEQGAITPVFRVHVNSKKEVASAHAAIAFAYTGRVQAESVAEALLVRRHGGYLQMKGCDAACDRRMIDILTGTQQRSAGGGSGSNGGSVAQSRLAAAQELYASPSLWPDLQHEPGFKAVVDAAQGALVAHFRSAFTIMNSALLMEQVLGLPRLAVEALLDSEAFGTDHEGTVFAMVAEWITANAGKYNGQAVSHLARKIRFAQLGDTYLQSTLQQLLEETGVSWLPFSGGELSFMSAYSKMPPDTDQQRWLAAKGAAKGYDLSSPSYSFVVRPPIAPAGTRLVLDWHISQRDLLRALQSGQAESGVGAKFSDTGVAVVRGLQWMIVLTLVDGVADIFSACMGPETLGIVHAEVELEVLCWRDGAQGAPLTAKWDGQHLIGRPCGDGLRLPLFPPADPATDPLAPWAEYLHEGKITGRLRILQ